MVDKISIPSAWTWKDPGIAPGTFRAKTVNWDMQLLCHAENSCANAENAIEWERPFFATKLCWNNRSVMNPQTAKNNCLSLNWMWVLASILQGSLAARQVFLAIKWRPTFNGNNGMNLKRSTSTLQHVSVIHSSYAYSQRSRSWFDTKYNKKSMPKDKSSHWAFISNLIMLFVWCIPNYSV